MRTGIGILSFMFWTLFVVLAMRCENMPSQNEIVLNCKVLSNTNFEQFYSNKTLDLSHVKMSKHSIIKLVSYPNDTTLIVSSSQSTNTFRIRNNCLYHQIHCTGSSEICYQNMLVADFLPTDKCRNDFVGKGIYAGYIQIKQQGETILSFEKDNRLIMPETNDTIVGVLKIENELNFIECPSNLKVEEKYTKWYIQGQYLPIFEIYKRKENGNVVVYTAMLSQSERMESKENNGGDDQDKQVNTPDFRHLGQDIDFNVYPNPIVDKMLYIEIKWKNPHKIKAILCGLNGNLIRSEDIYNAQDSGLISWDLSGLRAGNYVINLYCDDGSNYSETIIIK